MRERNQFGVDLIAEQVAIGTGRARSDVDVRLFAGVIVGARLAAQSLVDHEPGRSYIDTLDAVLARLEDGVPLAAEPLLRSS